MMNIYPTTNQFLKRCKRAKRWRSEGPETGALNEESFSGGSVPERSTHSQGSEDSEQTHKHQTFWGIDLNDSWTAILGN